MSLNILKQENWIDSKVYKRKRLVWRNNSVYIALRDNSDSDPSTDNNSDWMKLGDFISNPTEPSEENNTALARVDTEENYILDNPVLEEGELAFTKDHEKYGWYKLGNGTSTWSELNYTIVDGLLVTEEDIDSMFEDLDDGYIAPSGSGGSGSGSSSGGGGFANVYAITDKQINELFLNSEIEDLLDYNLSDDELINIMIRKKVSWIDGKTSDVATACRYSMEGKLDLYNDLGWRIGDTRLIFLESLPSQYIDEIHTAQPVVLVLTNRGGIELTTPVKNKDGSDRIEPAFQVDFISCFSETGLMNLTATNSGAWENSARRKWCNDTLKKAMQNATDGIFEEFYSKSHKSATSTDIVTTNDYFSLRLGIELFGESSAAFANEANLSSQIEYYSYKDNRIKKQGRSGTKLAYWLRSIYKGASNAKAMWVKNNNATKATFVDANKKYGIAPFGCIG